MRRERPIARCSVRRRPGANDGVALIVALLFVVLLSAIVIEYAYETQVEASLASNTKDDFQAYVAAKSAVATGLGMLEGDLLGEQVSTAANNAVNAVKNAVQSRGSTSQQQTQADAMPYDSLLDLWAQGMPPQPINDAEMQCTITDESGKINLNALFVNENETNPVLEAAVRELFTLLGFEEDPTDAILDWLDPDEDVRPNGAESEYYTSLETPYACRNGPMDSIDEVLLIKGITPERFFDCAANAEQSLLKDEEDRVVITLSDLFTVRGSPVGLVNVNTAPPEVLEVLLTTSDSGNPGTVDTILQIRAETPFQSVSDFTSQCGISQGVVPQPVQAASGPLNPSQASSPVQSPLTANRQQTGGQSVFDVKSDFFRIFGDGRSGDALVRIEAYVYRVPAEAVGMDVPSGGTSGASTVQPVQSGKTTQQASGTVPLETFRFLDWRVIK